MAAIWRSLAISLLATPDRAGDDEVAGFFADKRKRSTLLIAISQPLEDSFVHIHASAPFFPLSQ